MELLRALAAFAEPPGPAHGRLAELLELPGTGDERDWTQLFLFDLFPYASVHLGPEGQLGGVARDRVAGFLRALDAEVPSEPDHLVVLLAAYAELRERGDGGDARAAHAATGLLHEHLLPWLPLWLGTAEALAPEPWAAWATLCSDALEEQARRAPVASALPAHLAQAPGMDDPRAGEGDPLLEQLLVPVRTGFVLTTSDLRRAGQETGLGLRIGERRYVLGQLLGQDVGLVLRWLAHHAATTPVALARWEEAAPLVVAWWTARSAATAALLEELATEADSATTHPLV